MKMSKLVQRLLVFFVGVPLVMCIVYVNFLDHILLAAATTIFTYLASNELYSLFSYKQKLLPKPLVISVSTLIPVIAYLLVLFRLPSYFGTWALLVGLVITVAYPILFFKDFENANESIALSVFTICYSGYPLTFITRMTAFENEVYFICLFLCMVFLCDSGAWLFGMTMGKSNRGIIAASPNKSVAGFIGGYASSVAVALLATYLFPNVFISYKKAVILGIITATVSILGDLLESIFKRSAHAKDSGNTMPGRGGILDSIDSIIFSAPIYYFTIYFLYLT